VRRDFLICFPLFLGAITFVYLFGPRDKPVCTDHGPVAKMFLPCDAGNDPPAIAVTSSIASSVRRHAPGGLASSR
jgi:hypothetical protein